MAYEITTDSENIRSAGLECLYIEWGQRLRRYCLRLTEHNYALAEELFHDVFLLLQKARVDIGKIGYSYLATVAKNKRLNDLRFTKGLTLVSLDQMGGEHPRGEAEGVVAASVKHYHASRADSACHERIAELRIILERSMRNQFTEQEAELMNLHFGDELDFAAIAKRTGRSERDVAYSIQLLIKRLKYHVGKEARQSRWEDSLRDRPAKPTAKPMGGPADHRRG